VELIGGELSISSKPQIEKLINYFFLIKFGKFEGERK
jgi:hypothetical protein